MAEEKPKKQLRAPSILDLLRFHEQERQRDYEAVRTKKSKGHISPDGSVTIIVDGISSVHYDARGSVIYSW